MSQPKRTYTEFRDPNCSQKQWDYGEGGGKWGVLLFGKYLRGWATTRHLAAEVGDGVGRLVPQGGTRGSQAGHHVRGSLSTDRRIVSEVLGLGEGEKRRRVAYDCSVHVRC